MKVSRFALLSLAFVAIGCQNRAEPADPAGSEGLEEPTETDEATEPAAAGSGEQDPAVDEPELANDRADGAALYVEYCAFCHGDDGEGYAADNATALRSQTFLTTASDSFLSDAIVHGRPGTPMSAWGVERGGPLDDADVAALVAYMRQWQTEPSVELSDEPLGGVAARGQGPYNAFCSRCHLEDGSGDQVVSLNNPWLLHTASDEYLRYAILNGRDGTEMRGYSHRISEAIANDIVALIRSWQLPVDQDPPPPYEPDLDNARVNPGGPTPEFTLREERFVSIHAVAEAVGAGQSLVFIDARPNSDFSTSHIEGALNIPFYEVGDYADRLPRDTWIVTYCGCPHAVSGRAADALTEAGFERVAVLDEGFYEWEEAGYSVVRAAP